MLSRRSLLKTITAAFVGSLLARMPLAGKAADIIEDPPEKIDVLLTPVKLFGGPFNESVVSIHDPSYKIYFRLVEPNHFSYKCKPVNFDFNENEVIGYTHTYYVKYRNGIAVGIHESLHDKYNEFMGTFKGKIVFGVDKLT